MNKFKAFFTFIAFLWLLLCGFGAIYAIVTGGGGTSLLAWFGLLINAWALPIWMLLRYLKPEKFTGDLREPGAFSGALIGLAIVLLVDSARGLPIYLSICNLFILLIYLYHLSAVGYPQMPAVDTEFPALPLADDKKWHVEKFCREHRLHGVVVVFLRGSYCASSRNQLHQIRALVPDLARRNIGLLLFSTQPGNKWPTSLVTEFSEFGDENVSVKGDVGHFEASTKSDNERFQLAQLDITGESISLFVAQSSAPTILRPWVRDAARPSAWLIDAEGVILWRELSTNYRVPANADLLRAQLFRVDD